VINCRCWYTFLGILPRQSHFFASRNFLQTILQIRVPCASRKILKVFQIFQTNLYLYKIESLNFGRRDLGNGKSNQDMLYTNSFSMIWRWSGTHSNVNKVIMTQFPESQRNVVFTGMISTHKWRFDTFLQGWWNIAFLKFIFFSNIFLTGGTY